MNYKDFYKSLYKESKAHTALDEEKFKKRKNLTHVADVPMFSIYASDAVTKNPDEASQLDVELIKRKLSDARDEIHKIGFPSMHANVVIDNIGKSYPLSVNAVGLAVQNQFMVIDIGQMHDITRIAVHEWAHLWMAQKPKQFKKAVLDVYNNMLSVASSTALKVTYDDLLRGESSPKYKLAAHLSELVPGKIYESIIEHWKNYFYFTLLYANNRNNSRYRLFGKKFTKNHLDALPMGFTFTSTLKEPLKVTSLSRGNSIIAPIGSNVYVENGNGMFIVGIDQGGLRYENVVKYENVDKLLGTEIYEKIDQLLKARYVIEKKSKKQLESDILDEMKYEMRNTLKIILDRYVDGHKPSDEEYKMLDTWIEKYVYPMYLYALRNTKEYNRLKTLNKSEVYSYFWTQNKLKPADVSLMRFISFLYNRNKIGKVHNLTGEEHRDTRKILAELAEWVNEYGMSNNLELWTTAIELFFKLPYKYRNTIVKLMI